jgi:hypothetical protein
VTGTSAPKGTQKGVRGDGQLLMFDAKTFTPVHSIKYSNEVQILSIFFVNNDFLVMYSRQMAHAH